METDTDNPILEPGDVFYGTTEETELEQPTVNDDVANGEEQNTEAEAEQAANPDEEAEDVSADESEESESLDGDDETEDGEKELVYLDLDGEEVDLDEVRKWKSGHLMQKDYTRKTQALAEDKKAVEAERAEVANLRKSLQESQAELQALVQEDEAVDWDDLREYDPEKYIELKEKAEKRKAAADKFKPATASPSLSPEELASEQRILFEAHPSWLDDKGQPTEVFKSDQALIQDYWTKQGFTSEEISGMSRSRYIETSLKAAKYDELQEKSKEFTKKAKKATLVTKPKKQARKLKAEPKALEDVFYS